MEVQPISVQQIARLNTSFPLLLSGKFISKQLTASIVKKALCLDKQDKTDDMEVTAVVLHDGALAHYDVTIGRGGVCTAYLSSYRGDRSSQPPQTIVLRKEGRHWVGNVDNNNLSEDLGYAVELKAKPLIDQRKREGGHPAG